jgi:hypothetical protein
MTPEERKLIYEYCDWKMVCKGNITDYCKMEDEPLSINLCSQRCEFYHPLDGNDKDLAVKIMEERGESELFENFSSDIYIREKKPVSKCFHVYLLQNFFPLMISWLKERAK